MRMRLNKIVFSAAFAMFGADLFAQVIPALPYQKQLDLLVTDSSYDGVWRCIDWNQDGDFNDALEVVSFYSETIGSITLGNPNCIGMAPDGTAYVGDSTTDIIMSLRDVNGDGDANDPGEHFVFFNNANAAGIALASLQSLHVDKLGRVFLAIANSGSTGVDMIVRLEDSNGDGDALDPGEAVDYHTVPGGNTGTGSSIPAELAAGPDLNLYYADNGINGPITKGIYKLADNNFDGDCNDAGERTLFWDLSVLGSATSGPFCYGMAITADGRFYVCDHSSNETLWTARDDNGDGSIDSSEVSVYYQTGASTWWDVVIREDGALLLCEDQTPDRLVVLTDLNQDGDALDAGEAVEVYRDTVAANGSVRPRGATWMRGPELEASPASAPTGTATSFVATTTRAGDLVAIFLSTGLAPPVSLAPYGTVDVDVASLSALGFGVSNVDRVLSLPLNIPISPAVVGTYAAQAWSGGPFRQFLSNGATITVTL